MKQIAAIIVLIAILLMNCPVFAIEQAPRISDREIVERLTRIEEGQKRLEEGQKAILREFDKRFDNINNRFDDVNSHINRLASIFTAIVIALIGFAIWDRRTMVRPFEDKVKKIDNDIANDRSRLNSLVDALRELSKTDKKVAEILNRFNLL